jgi:selenocysteine lyase/cysteine desulfurase
MQLEEARKVITVQDGTENSARIELERSVRTALETYSNVHRGSGHHSEVSTHLLEEARAIVLEHLGLEADNHVVIFCTPRRAEALRARVEASACQCLSSEDLGLPLGVRALAIDKKRLPRGAPPEAGGGTARLVGPAWVVWARSPDRFEPGTPAIINIITFARALRLSRTLGTKPLFEALDEPQSAGPPAAVRNLRHDEFEALSGRALLERLRQTLVGHDGTVPTVEGPRRYVNLDNGASTPTFEPIWRAVVDTWRQPKTVREDLVLEVKSICAEVLGAPLSLYDVLFTSNTTEAINLAAESLGCEPKSDIEPVVVNTILEHNSNELPWRMVPGAELVRLPADQEGFLDPEALDALLASYNQKGEHGNKRVKLVAVTGASNVLGVCNDLAQLSRIAHRHGARLLVDGAQLVAHRKIEMEAWGIDFLAFSAHKAYAPFGTGALVVRKGMLALGPQALEEVRSSGEENAGGIAALGKALVLLGRIGFDVIQAEEQILTESVLRGLAQLPRVRVHGMKDPSSPRIDRRGGVIAFDVDGRIPHGVARALGQRGIGVRAGCHCAHLEVKRIAGVGSALGQFQRLIVMAFPRLELPGVVRVSLGLENTSSDVDALIQAVAEIAAGRSKVASGAEANRVPKKELERQMKHLFEVAATRVFGPNVPVANGASLGAARAG